MPATRKRAPARRKRSTGRRRARRRGGPGSLPGFARLAWRLPLLEQRERDVLGLALLACGVFMAFVLYGGWNGGRAGHALAVAFGWVLGGARVLAPVAMGLGGAALLLRPLLPSLRPLRIGSACLFAAATLALAAGTLGVSAGPHGHGAPWGASFLQARGGRTSAWASWSRSCC
jgi:S-DNA-T family DNA segregation ATPase FtsK/SpoIIIE